MDLALYRMSNIGKGKYLIYHSFPYNLGLYVPPFSMSGEHAGGKHQCLSMSCFGLDIKINEWCSVVLISGHFPYDIILS